MEINLIFSLQIGRKGRPALVTHLHFEFIRNPKIMIPRLSDRFIGVNINLEWSLLSVTTLEINLLAPPKRGKG